MGGNRLVKHDSFLNIMELLGGLSPAGTWSRSTFDKYSALDKPQFDLIFEACLLNEGLGDADAAGVPNLYNLGLHGIHREALHKVITL